MSDMLGKVLGVIGIGAGATVASAIMFGLLILTPVLFIWSANTLFGLQIAHSLWNWLVAAIFLMCVRG